NPTLHKENTVRLCLLSRVYNIFESLGIQQIFRTTNTTLAKIN
ncbi:28919_t:CDS:2, partial [Racocetra persica]